MPRRARVRSPRGAGVRPRRAALSTPASPRSNAVVVDGAPARRYCVIRRARPRATSQRATRAGLGDGPNLVHSSICRLWTLHNQSKKSFFALTFSRLRCTAASSVSATPPSNRLFSSSRKKLFRSDERKSTTRVLSPDATPIRDRERLSPGSTSVVVAARSDSPLSRSSFRRREGSKLSRLGLRDLGRHRRSRRSVFLFSRSKGAYADRNSSGASRTARLGVRWRPPFPRAAPAPASGTRTTS